MYLEFGFDENTGKPKVILKKGSPLYEKIDRKFKGYSIIDHPQKYVVIDIETTGLSIDYDEIIELSAVRFVDGIEIEKFSTLVKPFEQIDEFITKLTGITNEMVENAPDIKSAIFDFYNFVQDDILVGYNVNFDINFIYDKLLEQHNIFLKNNFIDVYRIVRNNLKELNSHRLKYVAKYYNLPKQSHRALDDCYLCNAIFNNIVKSINFDEFKSLYNNKGKLKNNSFKVKNIVSEKTEFDETHILYNKTCCVTGKLERMTRKQTAQIIADFGGINQEQVTKETDFLIMGNNDFCPTIKDGKSSKQKKAEKLILQGQEIQIIPEDSFYQLILEEE